MNIEEYIQSGIIESYVLGLAEKEEAAELELLRSKHPEIEAAIQTFEAEFEAQAMRDAIPVNDDVKANLFEQLNLQQNTAKVYPINNTTKKPFIKYLAAASVALLVLSAALNLYTYSKYKNLVAENRQLALQRDQLYASNSTIQTKMSEMDNVMKTITSPDMMKIALTGVPGKQGNEVVVYWGKTSKDVYLSVKNLPKAPAGKQYQLWALMDGKPIDAGMVGNCATICQLKNTPHAQAFAITLENEGGSPTPTLDQMFVMGTI